MTDRTDELVEALANAFPTSIIDSTLRDEPSATWSVYDDVADLESIWGKSWQELPAEALVRHATLPIYAGDQLFHAIVPAFLRHVLLEDRRVDELPFQLAGQLTRSDELDRQPKFDRRAALFTPAQRATVRDVLAHLSSRPAIDEPMARAMETWDPLAGDAVACAATRIQRRASNRLIL